MGPKVQGRDWRHLLRGSATKGARERVPLPLRCAWPLRARTWRPPERVAARLQGHNGQAIQRPPACAARAAPIIAGVWLAAHRSFLVARQIYLAVRAWWRRRDRSGRPSWHIYGTDSPSLVPAKKSVLSSWFLSNVGMSRWQPVCRSIRIAYVDCLFEPRTHSYASLLTGALRNISGCKRPHGRLPQFLSGTWT